MMDAHTLAHNLGGHWKNGRGQAPCPICQPERRRDQTALSISHQGGKLLLHCFKSHCSFVDIAQAADLPLEGVRIDIDAARESEAKQAAYAAVQLAKARSLWDAAKPIEGTKAGTYLRGRGITCPLPSALRFMPDIYHAPSASWACAVVANVSTGGVHRTFFDKQGNRLTKSAKMMLGPCAGGAVRLPALGIFSDEGGQFLGGHGMSADNRLKTVAGLSSLWGGDAINRTRAGDGAITLHGRRLAAHLMVQPIAARPLLADPVATGQGFLARLLIAEPPSNIGNRLTRDHAGVSDAAFAAMSQHLQIVLRTPKTHSRWRPARIDTPADAPFDKCQGFALGVLPTGGNRPAPRR